MQAVRYRWGSAFAGLSLLFSLAAGEPPVSANPLPPLRSAGQPPTSAAAAVVVSGGAAALAAPAPLAPFDAEVAERRARFNREAALQSSAGALIPLLGLGELYVVALSIGLYVQLLDGIFHQTFIRVDTLIRGMG